MIKIGIPRSMYYYYYKDFFKYFFEEIGCELIISPKTNKNIVSKGSLYAIDEMCLSLKIYLGHVDYLKDKCDYILIPRIDNYGFDNQTCTNFLSLYDIVNNMFDIKILNYDINYTKRLKELNGLYHIGAILGKTRKEIYRAYKIANIKKNKILKKEVITNYNKLNSNKLKVLIVSHPYNIYDDYIGKPIVTFLNNLNVEIIYSDPVEKNISNYFGNVLSNNLYWKYSKESIGAIKLLGSYVDGIIFLSTFPCGLDSLVNELMLRKISKPCLNLIIDDIDSLTGIETRLESFIDILEQRVKN